MLESFMVPVLLTGHTLRPVQQPIKLEWPETANAKARLLLKLKRTQRVSESEEMKQHQKLSSICFHCKIVITNSEKVQG